MKKFIKIFSLTLLSLILLVAVGFGVTYAVDSDLAKSWLSEIGITFDDTEQTETPSDEEQPGQDTEEPDDTSEYVTDFSDYLINGDTIVQYTGDDANIKVPGSYSISGTKQVTVTFNEFNDLLDYLSYNYDMIEYPFTLTDSEATEFEINDEMDITEFYNQEASYPLTTVVERDVYVEGDDYQITTIQSSAFSYNDSIERVYIEEGIETIQPASFSQCNIISFHIPSTVTSINTINNFNSNVLEEINVDPANTVYSSIDGILFNKAGTTLIKFPTARGGSYEIPSTVTQVEDSAFSNCSNLLSVTIPDSIINLGDSIFLNCTSLVDVNLPNNLLTIPEDMFSGCSDLISITIPESVINIGVRAFEGCSSLASITIPANVKSIGRYAFQSCMDLTVIIFEGTTPPTIADYAIDNFSLNSILVPEESVEAYKSALPDYTDIITANGEVSITA